MKHKTKYKAGRVYNWLDQGPVLLLAQCEIPDPIRTGEEFKMYSLCPEAWPSEIGWTISMLQTGEVLDVHEETLNLGATSELP